MLTAHRTHPRLPHPSRFSKGANSGSHFPHHPAPMPGRQVRTPARLPRFSADSASSYCDANFGMAEVTFVHALGHSGKAQVAHVFGKGTSSVTIRNQGIPGFAIWACLRHSYQGIALAMPQTAYFQFAPSGLRCEFEWFRSLLMLGHITELNPGLLFQIEGRPRPALSGVCNT